MNTNSRPMTHVDDLSDELRDHLTNGDPWREPTGPGDPWYAAAISADIHADMRACIDVTVDRPRSPRL